MSSTKNRQWSRSPEGFRKQDSNRARKVISSSSGIVRGKFPSRKNGRMMYHEGLLELAAFYWLEAIPDVVTYQEQPFQMQYPDGDKIRRYTPDIRVTFHDGEHLYIEVKPVSSLMRPEMAHKYRSIGAQFRRDDIEYAIWTDVAYGASPHYQISGGSISAVEKSF